MKVPRSVRQAVLVIHEDKIDFLYWLRDELKEDFPTIRKSVEKQIMRLELKREKIEK